MVLCTATAGNLRDVDFLPLTVDVEERMYAAGKIPGGFFKREGRPSEKGILTARMIDRPIRPLFPKGWSYETQIVATPMCIDHVNPYDVLAMNGASAALAVSDIPFPTQVGAVRIGKLEGRFVVNPAEPELPESELDLIVAGTDDAILMVEAGANEATEAEILDALDIAHQEIKKLCAAQRELAAAGRQAEDGDELARRRPGAATSRSESSHGAELDARDPGRGQARAAGRRRRRSRRRCWRSTPPTEGDEPSTRAARRRPARVRQAREGHHPPPDRGRQAPARRPRRRRDPRGLLRGRASRPRTHGSALFTRGQTQAFTVATLGTSREEQRLDTLGLETSKRYIHHYNFPPFSVGEAGFMRGPEAPRHRSRGARRAGTRCR